MFSLGYRFSPLSLLMVASISAMEPGEHPTQKQKVAYLMTKESLKEAIEGGSVEAYYVLGELYFNEEEYTQAAQYLFPYTNMKKGKNKDEESSSRIAKAFYMLGNIYEHLAVECYKYAAKKGNMDELTAIFNRKTSREN